MDAHRVAAEVHVAQGGLARLQPLFVRQRGRLVVVAALVLYFGALAALGGHAHWDRLGVPPASVKFLDLRNVIAAWQCHAKGIAVLPVNPCDPYHRPADFPKIWLELSFLGIGQGGAVALGVGIAVVFLVCAIFVVPAGAGAWTGVAYAAALCSPAVMLGVERGNPDIVIFPLVLAAVLLTTRTRVGQILTGALLLFVTVLKLYPAFAAAYLVRRATRASLAVLGVVAACSLVYVLATYHYIHEMLSSIPQSNVLTYGVRRASEWFSALAIRLVDHFGSYRAWDVLLALVGIALGWLLGRRLRPGVRRASLDRGEERDLDLFWAGACVYVGSYAVFLSHDYRLVFLLLTVPQIVRWTRARHRAAWVTVPVFFATLWLDVWTRMPVLRPFLDWWTRVTAVGPDALSLTVAVVAQFALFAVFIGWLIATAPDKLDPFTRRGEADGVHRAGDV
jgi:hypothetical protein